MFSGKKIQEQDIEELKSERRNPIIADLFYRMRYMERRGSGLNKIIEETQKLPGYCDRLMPTFYSTISSFTVILRNVNYSANQPASRGPGGEINGGLNGGLKRGLNETQQSIIDLVVENSVITTQSIADSLNITRRKVDYNISQLKQSGLVGREGSKKNGRWVVNIDGDNSIRHLLSRKRAVKVSKWLEAETDSRS